jgi:peptide/nickel transport system permease protein
MLVYIFRRLLLAVPTLWLALTLVFVIFRLVPGDPAQLVAGEMAPQSVVEQIRREMGLDEPMLVQYGHYLWRTVQGDLGVSKVFGQNASKQLRTRIPRTVQLALTAMLLAVAVGLPAGVLSAVRRGSAWDYGSMFGAILGVCLPSFWLGLMLILLFAVKLRWLPSTGSGTLLHLILPAVTLAANQMAVIARMTRSSMLEVVTLDFIRTARAKGLSDQAVVLRHALRNAMIPTVTVIGIQFGLLLGGSIVVESVFAWPGIGQLMIDSVRMRDYTMVQAVALTFALSFLLINIIVDVLYAQLDPRVRYE